MKKLSVSNWQIFIDIYGLIKPIGKGCESWVQFTRSWPVVGRIDANGRMGFMMVLGTGQRSEFRWVEVHYYIFLVIKSQDSS